MTIGPIPQTRASGTVMEPITARWTATRGRLVTWAYTWNVASLPKRLTSLAIVIALSGSPAVLSACMALCLQGVATAASHTDGQSAGHTAHVAAAVPAGASTHAHHGSPVSNESAATASATAASSRQSSEAPLSATCTNCCPEGPAMLAAGLGVERTDAKAFGAAPAIQVASFRVSVASHAAAPLRPPVPPPSPTRAPLALRL